MAGIARSRYISKRPRSLETWQSRSRFLFTRNTFSPPLFSQIHFLAYINKFNFRSALFLTSIYTQKSLEIPIAVEIARIGKEMYHACCAFTLIPEDFRGPSFLFFVFFSLFRFSFRFSFIDFRFVEWNSINERRRKEAGKRRISMCPERYCVLARGAGRNYKESRFTDSFSALFVLCEYNRLIHVEKCYIDGRVMLRFCECKYKSIWYNSINSY